EAALRSLIHRRLIRVLLRLIGRRLVSALWWLIRRSAVSTRRVSGRCTIVRQLGIVRNIVGYWKRTLRHATRCGGRDTRRAEGNPPPRGRGPPRSFPPGRARPPTHSCAPRHLSPREPPP